MAPHPYSRLPDSAYWRRSVAQADELDPMTEPPFRFGVKNAIVAAGSCFAQHIGRYLRASGYNYLITEPAHPLVSARAELRLNYGIYSARYGNVYTPRQMLQLFDRAYGRFKPREDVWRESDGMVLDPFRPQIQPGGFNSERELQFDRARHFRAAREAFEKLDIFIFTLGLTEAWRSREDGAIFPLCPGVAGGVFDPSRHEFVNFDVDAIVGDMKAFIARLRDVNRKARVILTVSPVPLMATAEPRHVLVSTVYSKSALRVACEILARQQGVAYFPAYEIVAGGFAGDYFAPDRRSVTEEGVAHVMRIFSRHFLKQPFAKLAIGKALDIVTRRPPREAPELQAIEDVFKVMCDEEALDLDSASKPEQTRSEG
jgi:hypothetical protein